MNNIIPLRAFQDNYIWALHSPDHCTLTVVDPGDPDPVLSYLNNNNLTLSSILITHHHHDHTGGVSTLCERFPHVKVYGPSPKVKEGDVILSFTIMEIPGHTLDHVAYYNNDLIFCGDTLFSCGCGRLFEGTAEQLYASLQKINQLAGHTLVYCAHEYTLANLKFAEHVDPQNLAIKQRIKEISAIRAKGEPSLPVTLDIERATNPFLRCHTSAIQEAVEKHFKTSFKSPVAVFAALRRWKDHFQQ